MEKVRGAGKVLLKMECTEVLRENEEKEFDVRKVKKFGKEELKNIQRENKQKYGKSVRGKENKKSINCKINISKNLKDRNT